MFLRLHVLFLALALVAPSVAWASVVTPVPSQDIVDRRCPRIDVGPPGKPILVPDPACGSGR
ncbi:hypothetical protein DLJ53_27750 [Acuticoccus sediminis]|uniref:Uncharacterized protein n=1 Tax=Acuticoccus sediminis TaxID=2184697 RepID=A0A8B2NFG7_9HYPH|nr:hypothetical protein [Acuticoccus sediminis]RAH97649.1 hypothetical protein DLJ53_27750 [Acuticoccus sediminis]